MEIQQMPAYEDDTNVSDTFVDGSVGVTVINGNFHITFFTTRMDHGIQPPPQTRRVSLRMVIPIQGAMELQQTIGNMVQILRDQKMIQMIPVVPGPQTRQ